MPPLTKRQLAQRKRRRNETNDSDEPPTKKQRANLPTLPLELIIEIIKFADVPDQRNVERAMPKIYQEHGGAIFRGVVAYRFPVEANLFGPMPDFNGKRKGSQTEEEEKMLENIVMAITRFKLQRRVGSLVDIRHEVKRTHVSIYPQIVKGGRPFLEFLAELRGCIRLTATMLADIVQPVGRDRNLRLYYSRWHTGDYEIISNRLRRIDWCVLGLQEQLQLEDDTLYETVLLHWRVIWEKFGKEPGWTKQMCRERFLLAQSEKQRQHYDRLLNLVGGCFAEICGLNQICDEVASTRLRRIDSDTGPTPLTDAEWKLDRERFIARFLSFGIDISWWVLGSYLEDMKKSVRNAYVARLRHLGHMAPQA
ncbi:MAG: hypothetical protein M1836_002797 [Candelina mexicana]|nr:MAG: hypothetical protein M1836_002797 [Candelina mexicana]